MKLPPGLIVLLYRWRWDLEPERSGDSWPSYPETCQHKVYDQFKNKLNEKKSWAGSVTAKAAQAVFLCLLHNLMVLFEAGPAETGISNAAEEKRREKVLTKRNAWNNRPQNAPHHCGLPAAHPAHRQIHPMAATFSLADPPPRRSPAHPEETLCDAMTFSRTPFFHFLGERPSDDNPTSGVQR